MAQIPRADEGKVCPFHRVDVSEVCHRCPLWMQLRGANPNTGQPIDEWGCAVAWLPVLLIEGAQQSRQTGAAVESFRNEMVKLNTATLQIIGASQGFGISDAHNDRS